MINKAGMGSGPATTTVDASPRHRKYFKYFNKNSGQQEEEEDHLLMCPGQTCVSASLIKINK